MKGDIHVHTNLSNGSCSIVEVLKKAKEKNIEVVGITNYDTIKELKEAIEIGEELGIRVIPGVEISAYDYELDKEAHILGYNFKLSGENITKLCNKNLKIRNKKSIAKVKALIENGYDITIEEVEEISKESEAIYDEHIMHALRNKGYDEKIYGDLYKKIFKKSKIENKKNRYVDVLEAVKAIKKDGGIAILAHPGEQNNYDIIPRLITVGLNGLEMYHCSHSEEDIEKIRQLSLEFAFILTGGSD